MSRSKTTRDFEGLGSKALIEWAIENEPDLLEQCAATREIFKLLMNELVGRYDTASNDDEWWREHRV